MRSRHPQPAPRAPTRSPLAGRRALPLAMVLGLAACALPAPPPPGPATLSPGVPGPGAAPVAPAPASRLRCGWIEATVRPEGSLLRLRVAGATYLLRPVPAASGARYEAIDDPATVYWNRGARATLTLLGRTYPECVVGAEGSPPPFVARGNEPGWELVLAGGGLRFVADMGRTRSESADSPPVAIDGGRRHEAPSPGGVLRAEVLEAPCTDTMSGMPFPATVTVTAGTRRWRGCGGETADLLREVAWVVEDIDVTGIVDRSRATLAFGPDGRLEGRGGCNRYTGFTGPQRHGLGSHDFERFGTAFTIAAVGSARP